jgi:hypothetical protein
MKRFLSLGLQMKFRKFFSLFGMFLLVISLLPLVISQEVVSVQTFGEEISEAIFIYQGVNMQMGIPGVGVLLEGVQVFETDKTSEVYFFTEGVLQDYFDLFSNIKPASISKHDSYIVVNKESNEIVKADFSIYSADQFIFGNNLFYVPDNSRVIFENGVIDLQVGSGSSFEKLPEFLDLGRFSNKIRVEGEGISFPDGIELVAGKIDLNVDGFEILEGDFNYKGNLISVNDDFEKVLVTIKDMKDYAGNWVKYSEDKLELNSAEDGRINIKFLGDSEFFDVNEDGNFLVIQVQEGDGLEIVRGGEVPNILHKSSDKGKTMISNGGLGTFVYTKDDVVIQKDSSIFENQEDYLFLERSEPLAMNIVSDSENVDLGISVNDLGEVDFFKGEEVVGSFNKELSLRLEGFSLDKLKRTYGENWEKVLEENIMYLMEVGGFSYKQAEKLGEKVSLEVGGVKSVLKEHQFKFFEAYGFTLDQQVDLVSRVFEKTGNPGLVLVANLPASLKATKEYGLTPTQSLDLISKIIDKSTSKSWITLGGTLPALLKAGLTPTQSLDLISKITESGRDWVSLAERVPMSLNDMKRYDLTMDQSIDYISKIIKTSGKHSESVLKYVLPATLEAGLTSDQSIDLISQIVDKSGESFGNVLYGIPNSLIFFDEEKIDEISSGLVYAFEFYPSIGQVGSMDYAVIKDEITLGQELANTLARNKDAFLENDFNRMAVMINRLHDTEGELSGTDIIRTSFAENSDFETKYKLISEANGDLYTSTFLKLYDSFPEEVIDSVKAVDPEGENYVDFVLQMANRGKAKEILEEDPSFFLNSIEQGISNEGSQEGKLLDNTAFLTNTFLEYYENPEYSEEKEYFENILVEKYQNAQTNEEKGAYAFLLKLDEDPIRNEAKEISRDLPELPSLTVPEKWIEDDEISMKSYYYEDEAWYGISIDQYQNPPYNMKLVSKTDSSAELIQEINGKKLRIVLTKDNSDVDEAINGDEFDIVSHRGHSYHLDETFSGKGDNEKLLYMGSCGSYCSFPTVQKQYPNSYLISEENTGEGAVNNYVSYYVMKRIAEGETEWSALKPDSADEKGIIFPTEKNQLLIKYIQQIDSLGNN